VRRPESCEHCVLGKKTKVKFGTIIHRTEGLFDLVHMDVWGITKTMSLGGHRYFFSFVNDLSRYCWVYPMWQRFEVLNLFVKRKNLMEKQTSMKIKVLQFDIVREYKRYQFMGFGQNNRLICISQFENRLGWLRSWTMSCWRRFGICCLMHNWTSHFELKLWYMQAISWICCHRLQWETKLYWKFG